MKKQYTAPDITIIEVAVEVPISASNTETEYPGGPIYGGGGTGAGGITSGDARRRGYTTSARDEMVGGWRRGGLW